MTSYSYFCFLQHIRNAAFPHVKPSTVLPFAEGLLGVILTETCYFYAQNLPTIVILLPPAGLALVLLILFFGPVHLPGGLMLPCLASAHLSFQGWLLDIQWAWLHRNWCHTTYTSMPGHALVC